MATYEELYALRSNSDLRNKIAVAVAVKAQTVIDDASPSAAGISWALEAIRNPVNHANTLMNYVLAANKAASTGGIVGASDAAIQNNVDAAVDKIIAGGA